MNETFDLTGRQVGRYKLLSPLGSGGMGVVYDAIDPALDRHVAVKVLRSDQITNSARIQRFTREARSASALSHPNVVTVHEIGTEDIEGKTIHFIAMEKVDGTTLRLVIATGSIGIRERLQLLVQVCDALAAAHAAGIVHRDLKPENVMVTTHGYAKVLDFGLAKLLDDDARESLEDSLTDIKSTSTGVVMGTAGYMSPEQARGAPADHRADIFALGCILYELVTGQRAFRGETIVDTLHQIIHAEPEPLRSSESTPESLQRIVVRAMAKDPARRYQSVKDLALDLREAIEGMEWKDRAARMKPASAPGVRRVTVLLVALVLLLGIALVAMLRSRGAAPRQGTQASLRIERITNSGDVINVAISPDGKYACFVVAELDGQSLQLRQLATGRELELVPKAHRGIWGVTFTPDGTAVVYATKGDDDPLGTFHRVPLIGGPAEQLATNLGSRVTFSPDGERMAWLRSAYPEPGQSALMVSRKDGTDSRAVAVRSEPERLSPIFFAAPSWSPDGKLIAAAVKNERDGSAVVLGFDPTSGDARPLTNRRWASASALEWMPDMSGILTVAADAPHARSQVWFVAWPSGDVFPVTNDIFSYRAVSVSADGRKLVTVATDLSMRVWVTPLDRSRSPERLTDGTVDGRRGVAYLADGRLVISSSDSLVRMKADGTGREERPDFFGSDDARFAASSDLIYFLTWSGEIGVVNFDGTDRRIIARDAAVGPFSVSLDGKSLLYTAEAGGALHEVPVEGGEPRRIGNYVGHSPVWSPAGDRIAFIDRSSSSVSTLVVIDAERHEIVWSHDSGALLRGDSLRWMRDGSGLIVGDSLGSGEIWLQSFDGTSRRLVDASSTENVYAFDVSPDGSSIAFSRGMQKRDAYLITGFR